MSNISYHCPNCGSGLKFNPSTGSFTCAYCDSEFNRYDLEEQSEYGSGAYRQQEDAGNQEVAEYYCNSCGAHIITASTTVATECYYCHNTVIMQKCLMHDDMPTRIIPFKMDKETAKRKFKEWIFKKTYIPAEFRDDNYIQKMQGVYFPYWLIDVDGAIHYEGKMYQNVVVNNNATFRDRFRVEKEGAIHMEDIMMSALKKSQKKLVEGVQPFDEKDMEPFTMTYLSGFEAEQKDIGVAELNNNESVRIFGSYAEKKIMGSLDRSGYHDVKKFSFWANRINWEYSLMPVWLITYQYKGETYYFAMNGQTGKTCGRIPIDKRKLLLHTMLVGAFSFLFVFGMAMVVTMGGVM